jgi:PKD repeat protein
MKQFITLIVLAFIGSSASAQCSDLFFSEYIEGSSNNKAIEIYNPTSNAIDLSNYSIERFNNGGVTPSGTLNFPSGTMIAAGDVYVAGNSSAVAPILNESDTLSSITFFNGDDAMVLHNLLTGDTLDIIGIVGIDPGAAWTVGAGATQNFTLVRADSVQQGTTDWALSSTQWVVYPIDTFMYLGSHTMTSCAAVSCSNDLFFSEYIEGSSSNKAFEIYNPLDVDVDLSNYVVYRNNNGSFTPTDSLFPVGILMPDSVFVVTNPSANPAIAAQSDTSHTMTFYNGDDAMYLVNMITGDTIDLVGEIGVDPGSGWVVGTGTTNNFTLIRQQSVMDGTNNWAIGQTQWDVFPIDMTDSLGAHTKGACPILINPIVAFDINAQTVNEGVGTVSVSVIISDQNSNPTSVDISVNIASTATNGIDFTFTSPTTVTFPANSSAAQTVIIPITDDLLLESIETIFLELSNPTNSATIAGLGTHTISIDDNELAPDFGNCTDLFFSEYLEGSSNNKAIEIYNPTCDSLDLSNYQIERFTNGSMTASGTYTFPAGTMLASQDVYVIGNASADPIILGVSDTTNAATFFNGDDAITLMNVTSGDTLDIIGIVGVDPGTNWAVGIGATSEYTLVRSANVHDGTTDWSISSTQWQVFPQNMFDSLGAHYATSCNDSVVASFTVQDTIVCIGTSQCFFNTSTGGGCATQPVAWDFGDGNTSTQENPCHTYPATGNYACTLFVTGPLNTSASIVMITVTDAFDPTITPAGPYCSSDSPVTLSSVDGGGVWSGTGITNAATGTFDPSAAGAGTHTITYTISGACGDVDSIDIIVTEPTVTFGTLDTLCDYNPAITLSQGTPAGGTYSGTGVSGTSFDPAVAGLGTHTITYNYTDGTGCSASATSNIVVDACAKVDELDLNSISIYPNPASEIITLTSSAKIVEVRILDLSGKELGSYNSNVISVDHLSNGTYVLSIQTEQGSISKRFIKE